MKAHVHVQCRLPKFKVINGKLCRKWQLQFLVRWNPTPLGLLIGLITHAIILTARELLAMKSELHLHYGLEQSNQSGSSSVYASFSLNLYELIKKNSYQGFSLSLIRRFCNSIVKCLRLLYQENIIHCDLKPVSCDHWWRERKKFIFFSRSRKMFYSSSGAAV